MVEPTIIDLGREKADEPHTRAVKEAIEAVAAFAHLGEIQAVSVLAVLNGDETYISAIQGSRASRLKLLGLLEELKAAILAGESVRVIEKHD